METKQCTKCNKIKSFPQFSPSLRGKNGLNSRCKQCRSEATNKYNKLHRNERNKYQCNWLKDNPEKLREYHRKALEALSKKINIKEYRHYKYMKHKEKHIRGVLAWQKANPEKKKEYARKTTRKYLATDNGRISNNMSRAIRKSLNGGKKNNHWEKIVGYTVLQLREHLEKQFTTDMTWDKYKSGKIHIDHKIPISAFNYTNSEDIDFKKCWALSNLQPLWARDNLSKKDKLTTPFQPSLAIT